MLDTEDFFSADMLVCQFDAAPKKKMRLNFYPAPVKSYSGDIKTSFLFGLPACFVKCTCLRCLCTFSKHDSYLMYRVFKATSIKRFEMRSLLLHTCLHSARLKLSVVLPSGGCTKSSGQSHTKQSKRRVFGAFKAAWV